nr:MAG TPA: hypothetical protein [Caudoviricetes sp.]
MLLCGDINNLFTLYQYHKTRAVMRTAGDILKYL